MPPKPSVGSLRAPFTSPCPPSNHTTMLIRLHKIPQACFMVAFVTSFLSSLDPNNNCDPSLGFKLGLGRVRVTELVEPVLVL